MRKRRLRKARLFAVILFIIALLGGAYYALAHFDLVANIYNLIPQEYYTAKDFNIKTVHSTVDFNKNGVDDYTDIMLGARKDAVKHPKYRSAYYVGGYPPDIEGVCTDVVWRAFKNAGYSLRDMVDEDIRKNSSLYFNNGETPDKNIDFRRVPNLKIYFSRKAISLTTDTKKIAKFQPGDIIIYGNAHIAVISDKRNKDGVPYIIHNAGQPNREENSLNRSKISGHYRFDAGRLKSSDLIAFKN